MRIWALQRLLKSQLHCPHRRVDLLDQVLIVGLSREAILNVLAKLCYQDVPRQEEKVKATLPNTREGASASFASDFSLQ